MLRVEVHEAVNALIMRIEGRLTREYANQVRTVMKSCETLTGLIVDLTELTFVDPVGEVVLLWLKHRGAKFATENSYALDVCERLLLPRVGQRAGSVRSPLLARSEADLVSQKNMSRHFAVTWDGAPTEATP